MTPKLPPPSRQRGWLTVNQLNGFNAGGAFAVDSADFDGTNDYVIRIAGLTGAADSKLFTFATWFRLDGGDGTDIILFSNATVSGGADFRFVVYRNSGNIIVCLGYNSAGTQILGITSGANTYLAGATWRWLGISCDMADTAKRHMYVGDTSVLSVGTYTNDTLDFTVGDWAVGALPDGSQKFNGCLAETYLNLGEYNAISSEAVRRKFYSGRGKPVNLGKDGALATGTTPEVYLHLDDGQAASNYATNRGSGGNFTVAGSLDTGSSSPSD